MPKLRVLVAFLLVAAAKSPASPLSFVVTCPKTAYSGSEPVSAVVYLSKSQAQPMDGPDWFHPEPCYSAHFQALAGSPLSVNSSNAVGFPGSLSKLEPGDYTVQAVVDRNLGGRAISQSPGNFYSFPVHLSLDPTVSGKIEIACSQQVQQPNHQDSPNLRYVDLKSPLLSTFYHRPTFLRAAIAFPPDYPTGPNAKFPTIYEVPGFGGSVDNVEEVSELPNQTVKAGQSFVYVLLDPNCPTGHCVFADSENNGPWGTALVSEMIPYLERTYRLDPRPSSRFVTGHSSGGWSSLWLQVTHPDFFGGVWSTSPDPVDFTDFQRIDVYRKNENMFFDGKGGLRPLAREGDQILANYKSFSDMERPIRGEQLGSFEAVFSSRGQDGKPKQLWNRDTGKIDPSVAEEWEKFDINLVLRHHWDQLGPKLRGKIHVYCGSEDTFYLDGAVEKLKESLKTLGSDANVELLPGNHFTVLTPALRSRIDQEMADQYRKSKQAD
jgi:pimeloyl-ACP methyl ester carboxylesterase